jgi:DME family drug/metabolite transporter
LLLAGFTFEFDLSIGIFASIGAGIGYALYTVNAKAMVKSGVDSTVALAVAFGGAVPIALLLLLTGELNWITEISGWGLAIYLGIVPTAVAYYFFGKGLVALSAATVATITLIEPVVATILALIVVGETLQLVEVAGIVIVIVGLGILSKIENRAGKQ